eukprot:m.140181 g.140181  ORF g.140181 m.140181 type:complete len:81 (+) comp17652_c0_seq5:880-1122(+)
MGRICEEWTVRNLVQGNCGSMWLQESEKLMDLSKSTTLVISCTRFLATLAAPYFSQHSTSVILVCIWSDDYCCDGSFLAH